MNGDFLNSSAKVLFIFNNPTSILEKGY